MAHTNDQVKQAWIAGNSAQNGKRNLKTDGFSLWSYRMLIGITLNTGEKCILSLYGDHRVSTTTQRHARNIYDHQAKKWLATDVKPIASGDIFRYIWNSWVFPPDMLAMALNNPRALDYSDAIVTMY